MSRQPTQIRVSFNVNDHDKSSSLSRNTYKIERRGSTGLIDFGLDGTGGTTAEHRSRQRRREVVVGEYIDSRGCFAKLPVPAEGLVDAQRASHEIIARHTDQTPGQDQVRSSCSAGEARDVGGCIVLFGIEIPVDGRSEA